MDMHLDAFPPLEVRVGYGQLGLRGSLGYEGKRVSVQGQPYKHALSTHPPARLRFHLGGRFASFRCRVALNDDVRADLSHADFAVIADGRQVASATQVMAGEAPRALSADIVGSQSLELVVSTDRWNFSHAVWLDPQVDESGAVEAVGTAREPVTYLDALPLQEAAVGYGSIGLHGSMGYENKQVSVQGRHYSHALSTHPPARLVFRLEGRFARFGCQVALNDDASAGSSHADFSVLADGRQVAAASFVMAGEPPRSLSADVSGSRALELLVRTSRWPYCHAVWLDPRVDREPVSAPPARLLDCLSRAEITLPSPLPQAERCIATIVSPGFEGLLDDLLGSLYAYGNCQDALLVVFAVDADEGCRRVAAKYGALLIPCTHRARINSTVKSVLYSVARVVDAHRFLCLDADMLVLGDLCPIFAALESCPEGSILAVREGNGPDFRDLEHALCTVYGGRSADIARLLGRPKGEAAYPLVVNDGTFAGSRTALLALDGVIRGWSEAPKWVDERRNIWWRNQFVFNLALAHLKCGVELDAAYNVQLNSQEVEMRQGGGRVQALWHGQRGRVLHFNGLGRHKYPEWRGLFARVKEPLIGRGDGDGYAAFLGALRAWVGRYGVAALAWSFYGTSDARSARVRDPGTFPLFALLHYLIRSNGCVRVLETGTARGVSAACLASAVAHRTNGRVVTLDPDVHPEREVLWAALPEAMHACIEPRAVGALEGMAEALKADERYDAVLLDSLHTEEHVWAEFELSAQLVCPGGLILIHDARLPGATVGRALQRIEAAGYGVVRLWSAEGGVPEDDQLGLAVIENRQRATRESLG
jgi:predicted O-methyltransferase YrrM